MQEKITFYFCTKNRNYLLTSCLDSIAKFSPNSKVVLANASTGEMFHETSEIISKYKNVTEVKYEEDPGMCPVYNEIYKMVETEFAALWSDDLILLRSIDHLVPFFDDPNIMLVALPMIDDMSNCNPDEPKWGVDEFGCALWNNSGSRCAHFSITRTGRFRESNVCGSGEPSEVTDNFFHNNTRSDERVWPGDGAYVLHVRFPDDTRINSQLTKGRYRHDENSKNKYREHLATLNLSAVKV